VGLIFIPKGGAEDQPAIPGTPRISSLVFSDSLANVAMERTEEFEQQHKDITSIFDLEREIIPYYCRFFLDTGIFSPFEERKKINESIYEAHIIMIGQDANFGPVIVVMTRERDISSKSHWFLLETQYV